MNRGRWAAVGCAAVVLAAPAGCKSMRGGATRGDSGSAGSSHDDAGRSGAGAGVAGSREGSAGSRVAISLESPRAALESCHQAAMVGDMEGFVQCFDPSLQRSMGEMAGAARRLTASCEAVGRLVEESIGRTQAERVRGVGRAMKLSSPLTRAADGAKVNWEKVKITVEGERATADVAGSVREAEFRQIGGKWYIVPPSSENWTADKIASQAERGRKQIEKLTQLLELFEKKVRGGTVKRENFDEELAKAFEAAET